MSHKPRQSPYFIKLNQLLFKSVVVLLGIVFLMETIGRAIPIRLRNASLALELNDYVILYTIVLTLYAIPHLIKSNSKWIYTFGNLIYFVVFDGIIVFLLLVMWVFRSPSHPDHTIIYFRNAQDTAETIRLQIFQSGPIGGVDFENFIIHRPINKYFEYARQTDTFNLDTSKWKRDYECLQPCYFTKK